MKKLLSTIALIFGIGTLWSQQEIQSTHFMVNPQLLNPAYSSTDNNLNVKAGYRNQWGGIEGAPNTGFLTFSTPIGKSRWARTHPGDFHNWSGVGAAIITDEIGPYENTKINLNYSYNIGLIEGRKYGYDHMDGLRFSLGASAGVSSYKINSDILSQTKNLDYSTSDHLPSINDPKYAELQQGSQNALDVNLGGILYYDNTYFLGLSTTQLLQDAASQVENISLARHYFLSGTYKWALNEEFFIIPSAIFKLVRGAPTSINFTTRLDWQDKWYLGLGYRTDDAATILIGSHIKWGEKVKHFRVDKHRYAIDVFYSYDWTTSRLGKRKLSRNSNGSHEITIAFFLPPMFHERNAEDTW